MFPGEAKSSNSLLLIELLCIGLGLLIVVGSMIPAEYVPSRWAPELERHRLDIAFIGLAIAVSVTAAAVLSFLLAG
jgi:hypothetical protein